jgi:hypothetical protein
MEGLLELQNEGNELGLVNTGASKSSTEIEGTCQSTRFKTIGRMVAHPSLSQIFASERDQIRQKPSWLELVGPLA